MRRSKVSHSKPVHFRGTSFYDAADLRALIRLQPNNTEAISELAVLLPPNLSSTGGSSSSANSDCLDLPKLGPPKPLPFETTVEDKRRLKLSNLPLIVDIPSAFGFVAAAAAVAGLRTKTSSGRKGKYERNGPRESGGMPMGPDTKENSGKGQTMSFTYPNWERYLVKKVTN